MSAPEPKRGVEIAVVVDSESDSDTSTSSNTTASSSDTTASSSDDRSSETTASSSDDSSDDSSSHATASTDTPSEQAATPPAPRPAGKSASAGAAAALVYELPDVAPVVFPPAAADAASPLALFAALRALPPRRHRAVDYFFQATAMFVATARADQRQQRQAAEAKGRGGAWTFRWANSGPIAEDFAIACDQAKILHASLAPRCRPLGGALGPFMTDRFLPFLASEVALPGDTGIGEKTMRVKLKDWEKGGTRYSAEAGGAGAQVTNVQFAAAPRRREKLEAFVLRGVRSHTSSSVLVTAGAEPAAAPPVATAPVAPKVVHAAAAVVEAKVERVAAAPAPAPAPTPAARAPSAPSVPVDVGGPPGLSARAAVAAAAAATPVAPAPPLAVKAPPAAPSVPADLRDRLAALLGRGAPALRAEPRARMPEFVQLCSEASVRASTGFMLLLLQAVAAGEGDAPQRWERCGGFVVARRFVTRALVARNEDHLVRMLLLLGSLRVALSTESRDAWAATPSGAASAVLVRPPQSSVGNTSSPTATTATTTTTAPPLLDWMRRELEGWGAGPGGRLRAFTASAIATFEARIVARRMGGLPPPGPRPPLSAAAAGVSAAAAAAGATAAAASTAAAAGAVADAARKRPRDEAAAAVAAADAERDALRDAHRRWKDEKLRRAMDLRALASGHAFVAANAEAFVPVPRVTAVPDFLAAVLRACEEARRLGAAGAGGCFVPAPYDPVAVFAANGFYGTS